MDFDISDLYKHRFLHIQSLLYILVGRMEEIQSCLEDMNIWLDH